MRNLVIFGASELAEMAHYLATEECGQAVSAFVVDTGYKQQESFKGLSVIEWPQLQAIYPPGTTDIFVALGYRSMRHRRSAYEKVAQAGYNFINLISPASYISNRALLGKNNMIMPRVAIEPHAIIGHNNVLWSNATICHNTRIGNHNFIAANVTLGGHVQIGNLNFLGFSSTIVDHVLIGDETLIGAHSLLRHATENLRGYWGVPARIQRVIDPESGICVE